MKNLFKLYSLIFASLLIVSCGDEDLEPTLAMDKDSVTGIQSADDKHELLHDGVHRFGRCSYR